MTAVSARSATAYTPACLAPSAVSLPILGDVFKNLFKEVDAVIQNALSSANAVGNDLIINAGRELALTIENAKNAYIASLDYTIDKIDEEIQTLLKKLEIMVKRLKQDSDESLEKLTTQATQLALALPFQTWFGVQTQLRIIAPHYVVPDSKRKVVDLIFKGIFHYAAYKNFIPTLTFGSIVYYPENSTNEELHFRVPVKAIVKNDDEALSKLSLEKAILSAPWDNGIVRSCKVEANYAVHLGALPTTPGKIKVHYTATKTKRETNNFTSEPVLVEEMPYGSAPRFITIHTKWKILQKPGLSLLESVNWTVINGTAIDIGGHIHQVPDENTIIVKVSCARKGYWSFRVSCTEFRDVPYPISRIDDSNILKWGESCVIKKTNEAGETVELVSFEPFDGERQEYSDSNIDHPYFKVEFRHKDIRLEATVPKTITSASIAAFFKKPPASISSQAPSLKTDLPSAAKVVKKSGEVFSQSHNLRDHKQDHKTGYVPKTTPSAATAAQQGSAPVIWTSTTTPLGKPQALGLYPTLPTKKGSFHG
jgi:hypothetical protein